MAFGVLRAHHDDARARFGELIAITRVREEPEGVGRRAGEGGDAANDDAGIPGDVASAREPAMLGGLNARIAETVIRRTVGDPVEAGLPRPAQPLLEDRVIVSDDLLQRLREGRITPAGEVQGVDAEGVVTHARGRDAFGTDTYRADLIVLATGYHLHYPFLSPELLRWSGHGSAPDLYLNIFTQEDPNLFVLGMIEASGIGWQGRYEQAELVAAYLQARSTAPTAPSSACGGRTAR